MGRAFPLLFAVVVALSGCAATRGPQGGNDVTPWPYAGITELRHPATAAYRDLYFSGRCVEIDPAGVRLLAETAIPGSLTNVLVPQGSVTSVFELGHGTLIENILFHPDGSQFFLLGSTVQPENYGEVQLSRSLLKIDPNLSILLVPIPLRPDGFSHGLVLLERDALVISLDTAGREVTGGATLARIDLLQDELTLTRPVGNVPSGVRRRGLAGGDDLDRRVYALLSDQGGGSDFDPPGTTGESGAYLAAIRLDSLTVEARLPLSENWDWFAVVPTALGVLVAGTSTRGTLLIEVDTQWMQESSRLELPEVVSDVVASGEVAVLPSSRGLYEIGLNFLALRRFIPADFQRTGEVAMTSDGSIACVMLEDPLSPGKTALGLVNLEAGGLERIVQ